MSYTFSIGKHKDRNGKEYDLEVLCDGFDVYVYDKSERETKVNLIDYYDEDGILAILLSKLDIGENDA